MTENKEEKIILIKDVGIEKTTIDKAKYEKITNILTIVWGILTLLLGLKFNSLGDKMTSETFKMMSDVTDALLFIFNMLVASGVTAIVMFIPSLFFSNRWELCTLWGKRIIKIIKYLIIFIPLYFLTSCIFGLGDVGNMLSNN